MIDCSYMIRKHCYANSKAVFGERTGLVAISSDVWVCSSSQPLFDLVDDTSMFIADHRKQFREHYQIVHGKSIEYVYETGSKYYINYPENPHGYDRMSVIVNQYVPGTKLTLYPIHDIVASYTHAEFLRLNNVPS